ncbi:MAG: beta-galactosidase [Abditibacteriota bacterium]|nr:beta-galactosidase [Abditibacteriota bacterium]
MKIRHILSCIAVFLFSAAVFAGPLYVWDLESGGNMTIANEGDGSTLPADRAGKKCLVINGEIAQKVKYFYFCLPEEGVSLKKAYLVLDLWSPEGNMTNMTLEHNQSPEKKCIAVDTNYIFGTGRWIRAAFEMKDFTSLRLLNYVNDLRVSADGKVAVRRAEIYESLPEDITLYDFTRDAETFGGASLSPEVSYVVGNDASVSQAALFRAMGFTAVDSYSVWQTVEPEGEGEWDFSRWDRQVEILRTAGLKWVPLLCAGPAYADPNWFRETEDHYPCVCLEHGEKNKIESLWNPRFRYWRERYLAAFAEHFDENDLECVKLGIQGDYGEAIYSADGGGWTFDVPGEYHQHHGYWCNDPFALADYREYLKNKYKTPARLSRAWGRKIGSFDEADFPFYGEEAKKAFLDGIRDHAENRREFLDFRDWYRAAMTELADDWMAMVRRYFPRTPIYLSTGGFMMPHLGAHFPEQARAAAKSGAGIRITNEASDYGKNFAYTRIVASACRHYGSYFCYEPAGEENIWGIPARIYNAAASGAKQLHDYHPNLINSRETLEQQQKYIGYFRKNDPVVPVAVYYPDTYLSLKWDDFHEAKIPALRDRFDFGMLDDTLILDGALGEYKVLVIAHADVMEDGAARMIAAWAKAGGRVLVLDADRLLTPEGKASPEYRLFPSSPAGGALGKGFVRRVKSLEALAEEVKDLLCSLGFAVYDTAGDGVFYTQISPGSVLVYNSDKENGVTAECFYRGKRFTAQADAGGICEIRFE